MLFAAERLHFFRPLTGKYREQVVACLRSLYARLYSSLADYSRVVDRDVVIEAFEEAITRASVLDDEEDDTAPPARGEREQANWMLNLLLTHGWLERHVDEVTLTSTYSFSRIGRLFTQPMEEIEGSRFRTRHRNTRNTCSALRSFLEKHEVYDLLDAYEYSERIVSDFSDVIAELEDRKRQLVREVEAQQLVHRASEEFFDFMEKRFMPDLALRFSEDSVVKYRDELDGLLRRARAQRTEVKREIEIELRRLAPELITEGRRSVYMSFGRVTVAPCINKPSSISWRRCSTPAPSTLQLRSAERAAMREADTAPVWLRDEQELTNLLHAAIDRFDRQPASARQRDVLLPVEQYLSALSRADAAADQLWSLVQELERHGVLTIRLARRGPFDPDWKGAKLAFPAAGEQLMREWLQREPLTPELQKWREAIRRYAHAFPGDHDALVARRVAVEGRSSEEVVAAFASISRLRGPLTLRQLSALAFWGDSKLLDDRSELIAALFPQLEVRERAIVVAVYLPQEYDGVLFIENQDTYTTACGGTPSALARLALVFASGFRSSAERVRVRDGAILHYAGEPQPIQLRRFDTWWFDSGASLGPCWFWGDLDFAEMQILKALRSRFGDVRAWQPGYAPMLAALGSAGGYSTISRHTRGQVDPGATGCAYADDLLLPAVRKYGALDQELPASPHDA